MPVEFKIKLVRIGNSLRMTLPKEVCEALGVKEGTLLGVSVADSHAVVRKVK
jgi:antitoxin component of MazEF toxin-antitoxin module